MRLKDKTALITGAGSGIGRCTALLFAEEGAGVVVNDIDAEGGQKTVEEITQAGGKAYFIQGDVTSSSSVEEMKRIFLKRFDKIDVLFNNAGISNIGALHEVSEKDWDKLMNVNIKGVFLMTKSFIPFMMERKTGSIINMSSCAAEIGLSKRVAYSATKGAVLAMTKAMQVDYAPYQIRVNALLPGTIFTPFVENYLKNAYENVEEALNKIKSRQLSGEIGKPIDAAMAALYLASDESKFMMGSPLYIDGGATFGKDA
ncbi:SDR family NAD(P)-dependent oxidoreductase [Alteribacillus sp. HJP-4]|uniref:SDR family NAD(P)-dependent oxidoreductase n=1 Tax=Alteribacillus sp. HJP-4 TaxID=2775394 RepID=UPI0035CCD3AA